MVKLKKKSLSRGVYGTHGRVIGNKNFFFWPYCLLFFCVQRLVDMVEK